MCFVGDLDVTYGVWQYGILVIEFLAIVIYSSGPSSNPGRFWLRFQLLFVIAFVSLGMFLVTFSSIGSAVDLSPLYLGRWISGYVQPFHAFVVALLGLLEYGRMRCTRCYRAFEGNDFILFQLAGWLSNRIFSLSPPSLS